MMKLILLFYDESKKALDKNADANILFELAVREKIGRFKYIKEDGTKAILSGEDGDVMVEIPEFFYKVEESFSNDIKTIKIKIPIPNFVFLLKLFPPIFV